MNRLSEDQSSHCRNESGGDVRGVARCWQVLMLTGVLCLPACTSPSPGSGRVDHVFAVRSPCEMECEAQTASAQATYPDQQQTTRQAPQQFGQALKRTAAGRNNQGGPPLPDGLMPLSRSDSAAPLKSAAQVPVFHDSEYGPSDIQLVSWETNAADDPGSTTSGGITLANDSTSAASRSTFTPAEPRLPLTGRRAMPGGVPSPATLAELYPDEYLFDGGDRGEQVHYSGTAREGFESEDTIAEYKDHRGDPHIRASNSVAIYAPRFASVRSITAATADVQVDQAMRARDVNTTGQLDRSLRIAEESRGEGIVNLRTRARADGVEHQNFAGQNEQHAKPALNNLAIKAGQDRQAQGMSLFLFNRSPELNSQIDAALAWSRNRFPQMSASTSSSQSVKAEFTAEAMIGLEEKRGEKSHIQIVKTADRDVAIPGEEITFTLRYFNTGDFTLSDIRIVDNLTPRLQYVVDSATTDRAGEVTTEPNGEGSQILTFTLDEPLKAREFGTLTFQARVR